MKGLLGIAVLGLSVALNLTFVGVYGFHAWKSSGLPRGGGESASVKSAAMGAEDGAGGFDCQVKCVVDELKLTPQQRARVQQKRKALGQARSDYLGNLSVVRSQLADVVGGGQLDGEQLEEALNRLNTIQRNMQLRVIAYLREVMDLLDDQQKAQFRVLLRSHLFQGLDRAGAFPGAGSRQQPLDSPRHHAD